MNPPTPPSINLELLPDWAKEPSPSYQNARFEERGESSSRPPRFGDRRQGAPRRSPSSPGSGSGGGRRPQGNRGDGRSGGRKGGRGRFEQEHRQAPQPIPEFNLQIGFIPEEKGYEAIVEQIRLTAKAYPLFSLAKLFLEKTDRHSVHLSLKGDAPLRQLFQSKLSMHVFTSEAALIAHQLKHFKGQFYSEEKTQTEAPKGQFTSVAQCRLNGRLIAPSNHHSYPLKLMELYKAEFSNMSFDRFKQSVVIQKDPELVKKWQEESTWKTVFKIISTPDAPALSSESDLEKHFKEHFLADTMTTCTEVTLPGELIKNMEDMPLRLWIRSQWEKEDHFPIRLAGVLRDRFFKSGLFVFKGRKGMQFVTIARPKALLADAADVSRDVVWILEYIQAHPGSRRNDLLKQWTKKESASTPPGSVAVTDPSTQEADLAKVLSPVLKELHWLVRQGHIIEYNNGLLEIPRGPKPRKAGDSQPGLNEDASSTDESPELAHEESGSDAPSSSPSESSEISPSEPDLKPSE